jgi:hypothetical protein
VPPTKIAVIPGLFTMLQGGFCRITHQPRRFFSQVCAISPSSTSTGVMACGFGESLHTSVVKEHYRLEETWHLIRHRRFRQGVQVVRADSVPLALSPPIGTPIYAAPDFRYTAPPIIDLCQIIRTTGQVRWKYAPRCRSGRILLGMFCSSFA